MLRLDPKEAPGRASTQGAFPTWRELISAPPQGNSRAAPGWAPGAPLALQPFRTSRISSTSGPLPEGAGSCQHVFRVSEALVTPPHKKARLPLGAHNEPGIAAELRLEAIEVTPSR